MIFGEKINFAVEFELNENHGGAWMFGRFGYWINNSRVGDFESGTSLRDVFFQLNDIVKISDRSFPIDKKRPSQIYEMIDSSIYRDSALIEAAAKYILAPQVDIFDDVKIYGIDCSRDSCLLVYKISGGNIVSKLVPHDVLNNSLKLAYKELENIYEAEIK
ncbi:MULTISPECIES: Imm42 family immunity protein [Xanthomonas]|uniref:Imm42 family immunity protein n=1 Tax=Xanthomonas TaxID=338 RepID=UPI000E1F44A3|nr:MULTISPECIES: Imm42 family immunity protein [Xanthomonas]